MPTYEYKCSSCDHSFEVFQSIKDDPISECEKCSGQVRRVIGPAGVIFKGSGFYVNDYKNNKSADSSPACSSCPSGGSCPANS